MDDIYWIKKDGRWTSIFITPSCPEKNRYGEILGKLFNIRRRKSHKKIRLCWKNLSQYRTNVSIVYPMNSSELKQHYRGPYSIFW